MQMKCQFEDYKYSLILFTALYFLTFQVLIAS